MELYIDVGNTNTVFALAQRQNSTVRGYTSSPQTSLPVATQDDPRRIVRVWRCATQPSRCADEYWGFLNVMAHFSGKSENPEPEKPLDIMQIERVLIVSVVPEAREQLEIMAKTHTHVDAIVINAQMMSPFLPLEVFDPNSFGADRLINAFAAIKTVGPASVVVDFGTATTFDVINDKGTYIGGVICAGIDLVREALKQKTALLPSITLDQPETVIGGGTVHAMRSGLIWGYVAMLEGLLQRIKQEVPIQTVVATGGHCTMFANLTNQLQHADPLLTIRGLGWLSSQLRNETP